MQQPVAKQKIIIYTRHMEKDIKKVLKLVVNITESHKKMIDEMSKKRGITSASEIIRWCIAEAYNKK